MATFLELAHILPLPIHSATFAFISKVQAEKYFCLFTLNWQKISGYTMPNIVVTRSIRKLGKDIRSARLRRRLPMSLVAERAGISTRTLSSLEKGETGVSIGHVAAVIAALGMGTPFSDILDQKNDSFGLLLDEGRLPKRARLPRKDPVA